MKELFTAQIEEYVSEKVEKELKSSDHGKLLLAVHALKMTLLKHVA